MTLYVKLLGKSAPEAADEMFRAVERIGSEISLTNENSALYRFNEHAEKDEKIEISKETHELVSLALEYEKETLGAFSIGAYNLSKLWGVDAGGYISYDPFEDEPVSAPLPDYDAEVLPAKSKCDTSLITLYSGENGCFISKSDKSLKIDLGGIAKGYCADLCAEIARKHNLKSALVNVSGNIVLSGGYYDGRKFTDWEIAVIDPRPKASPLREEICLLKSAGDVSIVTSGDYRRYYRHESGLEPCHIIDPRSGLPCGVAAGESGYTKPPETVSSATVICGSSARADAYSTALCVMGLDAAVEFLKSNNGADAVIFTEKQSGESEIRGRMFASDGLEFIKVDTFGGFRKYEKVAA